MKRFVFLFCIYLLCLGNMFAEKHWQTHFSYNSVQVIAMDKQEVYALANGKIFSINQQNEYLTLFTNFSGLHGTEISYIAYDDVREQLLIFYSDGKIDVQRNGKMQYVADLYNKQMTSSKRCNNVTIHGVMAYLAMDFGILTFDLELYEFVDTYYIAPEAKEIQVMDVMFYGDSIYAKTPKVSYAAHMEDNIVDFRCWRECNRLPHPFDTKKGKEYTDSRGSIWKVAGEHGVSRDFVTGEKVYYLPDGPCVNNPYHIEVANGRLYMVPGGRWASQDNRSGDVMIYEDGRWTNIKSGYIEEKTTKKALDFVDIAVDPSDPSRFFVASYGTGLYEFKNNELYARYTAENSILGSALPNASDHYTRVSSVVFDSENRLWVGLDGGMDTTMVCFLPDGTQRGLNFYTDPTTRFFFNTSSNMVVDAKHPEKKWLASCRSIPAVVQLDDGGTSFDSSDDQCKVRSEFYDQEGKMIVPEYFYTLSQAPNGDIWIGSSLGPIIISEKTDFMQSNQCFRLRIEMLDGSNFLDMERVNAFAWDNEENIWIGTQTSGVYVLNPDATEILYHYTSDNSVMPSNCVVSLAYDDIQNQMFIATGMGLVSFLQEEDIQTDMSDNVDEEITYGSMYQWRSHAAFTKIEEVVSMGEKVYGLSSNSLFSVDKNTGEIEYYTKLNGLSSSVIDHIAYNDQLDRMLITYRSGMFDVMDAEGVVYTISDLYLKSMSGSKQVNDICMHKNNAILAMNFGILVVDMKKVEIADTYYIGNNGAEVTVKYITATDSTIYAATDECIYCANLKSNLTDYSYWKTLTYPIGGINGMRAYNDIVHVLVNQKLYVLQNNSWLLTPTHNPPLFRSLCTTVNGLFAMPKDMYGVWKVDVNFTVTRHLTYGYNYAIQEDNDKYWLGSYANGLICVRKADAPQYQCDIQEYYPDGPVNNFAYRLRVFGDKLYMLPGGRGADEFQRPGEIMIYKDDVWTNIKNNTLKEKAGGHDFYDFMNVAQDPQDDSHYFVTSYGTGLLEMKDTNIVNIYLPSNSGLFSAAPERPNYYTRTDGAMYDDRGNLWVLNAGGGKGNVHVVSSSGVWKSFDLYHNGLRIELTTPGEMLMDNRNSQWKWIPLVRHNTGLILLQDNGTPTDSNDDNVTYRNEWVDQNNKQIKPNNIYSIAQDNVNTMWVGTSSGIFAIPASVDFTTSNKCIRVVIPRNDGSGLGDYLLDNEQINAIAIDGANRLWVGTASSGIYLLKPVGSIDNIATYTVETVAHFTTNNSILPTDEIISIAIKGSTGEVFIGTSGGLVSYMSDATEPQKTYDNLYAYPNPVHPNYQGYITFKGLMDNSEIRIVDANGNLVNILEGTGGSIAWDGTNSQGRRVASGVYTALCNTKSGEEYGTIKVLIMN